MNEHMTTSRVEQMKHLESKVRRYHEKFKRVGNRSMPEKGVKGVQSNENKYCVCYQIRSLGRWPVNYI